MNAMTDDWVAVCEISDIPLRGSRCLPVEGKTIALFRTAMDEVYALEDRCPHKNGPLSQGIVHDGCVTCPLHNWVISLKSGEAQGADEGQVDTFPVRIEADTVLINLTKLIG